MTDFLVSIFKELELRQYKNGFASVKSMFVLKLPPIFPCRVGEGKSAAISKQTCFSQKRVRSYIVLALGYSKKFQNPFLTMIMIFWTKLVSYLRLASSSKDRQIFSIASLLKMITTTLAVLRQHWQLTGSDFKASNMRILALNIRCRSALANKSIPGWLYALRRPAKLF